MSEYYSEFGFYVCRKCLTPGDSADLVSIFDGPGRAKVFEEVTECMFRTEDKGNDVLVCEECIQEVYKAFEFRLSVWNAEVKYFTPMRANALTTNNFDYNNFNVCRVCLSDDAQNKTIFKENSSNGMEYVEMLFHLTDLNMTLDYGHFSGRICISCIDKLEGIIEIRNVMRNAERSHFGPCRASKIKAYEEESKLRKSLNRPRKSETKPKKPRNTKSIDHRDKKLAKLDSDETDKENRPFQCKHEGCFKSFQFNSKLSYHEHTVHADEQLPCHCGRVFKCKVYLRSHQKRVHKSV